MKEPNSKVGNNSSKHNQGAHYESTYNVNIILLPT